MMELSDIERMLRHSLRWFAVTVVLAVAITGGAFFFFREDLLNAYDRMTLWNLMAMITFLFIMMNPSFQKGIRNEGVGTKDVVVLCSLFAVMSVFTCLSVHDPNQSLLFNMGFIVPMMAGFAGGWRIGIIVASIASFMQLLFFGINDHTFASIAVFFLSGALAGMWPYRTTLEPGSIRLYPAPVMIAFIAALISSFALYDEMPSGDVLLNILGCILLPTLMAGVLSTIGYELIIQFVRFRTNAFRSQNDLSLAHDIQMSSVPKTFPGRNHVSIGSFMEPAVAVGGDFYDVFEIREGLIGFVIADVSGKGLPAALFMMRAQATVRANAMTGLPPDEVLKRSNIELVQRNDMGQFVTLWVGILDTDTGRLTYSNAGHTVPYLRHDGTFIRTEGLKGLIMGYSKKARYSLNTMQLSDGDAIFLYTDGVNEAFNETQEQYGQERLAKALNHASGMDPQGIVDSIRSDIREFVGTADVSDDITMLCFSADFGNRKHISCESDKTLLDGVISEIHDYFISNGCPEKAALKMDIVIEELFVNICNYSYEDGVGHVDIFYSIRNGLIEITFEDSGVPFNPTGRSEVVLDEDISKWPIGGLGVHMSIKLTDSAHYKRISGRNTFTVTKDVSS